MDSLEQTAEKLSSLHSGFSSVGDVLMKMNDTNQAESGLDMRTYLLVRLAALAASDAPAASYALLITMTEDEDISLNDFAGVLVGIAPVVGGPRVAAAAERLFEAAAATSG
jgi:hypothetical protein